MLKFTIAIFASILAFASALAADAPTFAVGQEWTVKDSDIKIVIGRIEPFAGGKTAISVSVLDVPCPPTAGCTKTVVAHAPFDSEALAGSVDKLIDSNAQTAPDFEDGYTNWKQASGGVFTVPVSKLPVLLFKTLGSKHLKDE